MALFRAEETGPERWNGLSKWPWLAGEALRHNCGEDRFRGPRGGAQCPGTQGKHCVDKGVFWVPLGQLTSTCVTVHTTEQRSD